MTQPRMKLPPQQRPAPSAPTGFYPGPSVSDVLARLRAANVDAGLVEAYLREERLRRRPHPAPTWQQAIADFKRAIRPELVARGLLADPQAQGTYALAGPSKGDCE